MTDRVNRRDLIIETAAELFKEHGYNATSVRQIADAVGVTEAALYYHFKAGKRELLEAVLECQMPDFAESLEHCMNTDSIGELIYCFASQATTLGRASMDRFRWIISEFPHMTPEERATFHNKHLKFHAQFTEAFQRFIPDPEMARRTALIFVCMMLGYGQLYWNMEMETVEDFPSEMAVETIVKYLQAGIK